MSSSKETDPYAILGVSKTSTADDIKKAYRKLAMKTHPDKGGDPDKFKELSAAYEILSDPEKRRKHDNPMTGIGIDLSNGFSNMEHPMSSMFSSMFGFTQRQPANVNHDKTHQVVLSLRDMYFGKTCKLAITRSILCPSCKGEGGEGKRDDPCVACGGKGMRITHTGNSMRRTICMRCQGNGKQVVFDKSCDTCTSSSVVKERIVVEAKFPPGSSSGSKVILREMGDYVPGRKNGDIIIVAKQKSHDLFKRSGNILRHVLTISLKESLCGFNKTITHLDDREIPIESKGVTTNGSRIRVEKEGIPRGQGSIDVEIKVLYPKKLSQEQVESLSGIL